MRRGLTITLVTGLVAFGMWRGLAGNTRAAERKESAPATARAAMTPEEWRHFSSQASHWRQCLLKK